MLIDGLFQFHQRLYSDSIERLQPFVVQLADWGGVQVMEFEAAAPERKDEAGSFKDSEVLGHGLSALGKALAKLG